jgi:hypothetical protein
LLGFTVGEISMDAKWADFGEFGHVSIRWAGDMGLTEEFAFARAIVAASGPIVTGSVELDSSRGDRSKVEAARWPAWSADAWEFMVLDKTERLVRSEPFRRLRRRSSKRSRRSATSEPCPATRCAPFSITRTPNLLSRRRAALRSRSLRRCPGSLRSWR